MKNIYPILTFLLALLNLNSYAQDRFVDFEAECLYPKGTYENGSRGILRFNGINHGPDEIKPSDSLWYVLFDKIDGQIGQIYYQGPLFLPYGVPVGERFYYKDNYSIALYFPDITEPKEVQFCMRLVNFHTTSKLDTIHYSYRDTVPANDTCCQTLTILPLPNSIASVNTENDFVYIYPNPSNGQFKLVLDWLLIKEQKIKMAIYDLNGRLIFENDLHKDKSNSSITTVDLMYLLRSGVYVLHLQTGSVRHIKKLVVK